MTPRHKGRRFGREDGAALVETAFALPLMLLVCVGIFEFGRAYQAWQVVTNAAREGARVAVLPDTTNSEITTRVRTYLEAGALDRAGDAGVVINRTATVSVGAGTASASRVTVNYPFEFMVLQPVAELIAGGPTLGQAFTMSASATMRNE